VSKLLKWSIVFVCLFMLAIIFFNFVTGQERGEYPRQEMTFTVNSEKIDQDSVLVLFSTRGLLGLLKEYQTYCDTVTIGKWEYVAMPITMPDSTIRWVMDSTLVRFPRKQYRNLMFLFPEDFVNWLENVKLKGIIHE